MRRRLPHWPAPIPRFSAAHPIILLNARCSIQLAGNCCPHGHIRRNVISAVGNHGEFHFMTYTGMLDGSLFILSLQGLLSETTRKIYLMTDRLGAYDCRAVWD